MTTKAYRRFQDLLEEGKIRDAIKLADRELEQRGGTDAFWLTHLSRAHLRAGEHEKALREARNALDVAPDNEYAMMARGRAFRALNRMDRALEDFREAASGSNVDRRAKRQIVEILVREQAWRKVLDCLEKWSFSEKQTLRWKVKALAGLGRTEKARETADRLLEIEPDDRETLWELVEMDVEEEGLETVRKRYARLARIPSRPPVYREIYASLCRRAGDEETAAEQYRKIEREEASSNVQRKRAFSLSKSGREEEAIPMMEELLRQSPTDYYVHNAYIAACRRTEQLDRALNFYDELLEMHPDQKKLYGHRKKVEQEINPD